MATLITAYLESALPKLRAARELIDRASSESPVPHDEVSIMRVQALRKDIDDLIGRVGTYVMLERNERAVESLGTGGDIAWKREGEDNLPGRYWEDLNNGAIYWVLWDHHIQPIQYTLAEIRERVEMDLFETSKRG